MSNDLEIYGIPKGYKDKPHLIKDKECLICYRKFPTLKKKTYNRNGCCRYCSSLILNWKRRTGVYKQCEVCDKLIWYTKGKKPRTCGKRCANILTFIESDKRKNRKTTGRKKYYGVNWLHQRRMARKRDNYKCAKCGIHEDSYGQELSVHHIEPFV